MMRCGCGGARREEVEEEGGGGDADEEEGGGDWRSEHSTLNGYSPQPPPLDHLVQTISALQHRVEALESSLNLPTHQPLRHAAARVIQTRFRSLLVRRSRALTHLKHVTPSNSLKPSSSSHPHFDFSAPSLNLGLNPPGDDSDDAPLNLNAEPATCETGISIPSNGSEQLAIVNPCSTSLTKWKKDEIKIGLSPPGVVDSDAPLNSNADPATCGTGITIPSSNGSEQLAIANTTTQPHGNGECKKDEIQIVQSVNCEVCKIDCRTKQNLDQHKLGKKHKKNLEKLTQVHPSGSSNPAIDLEKLTQVHPSGPSSADIGPQQEQNVEGKSNGGHKKKRKNETPEDLERKKKKLIETGTVANAVRTCDICNVVCNDESVYKYHLAGKKHAAMVKKASDLGQGNAS